MTRYTQADGKLLVLSFHTPAQWADEVEGQLRKLGCSESYAARRAELIRTAE